MKDMTRRGFVTGGIGAAFALGLVGCASSQGDQSQETDAVSDYAAEERVTVSSLPATERVELDIAAGTLTGFKWGDVYHFRGIQYGTAERWQDPKPIDKYEGGVASALSFGPVCPSDRTLNGMGMPNPYDFVTPSNGTGDNVGNEQCLYLNVWTKDPSASRPVLVFFHGGGLLDGSSTELSYYDGANFADREDVVFVSVNHRLNVFGFFDMSAYGSEFANSANAGIEDCVLALKWIQDNIASFGGDPKNVTIMGQSGGGIKVTTLACREDTADLFSKVVTASGGWTTPDQNKQSGLDNTKLLVDHLGLKEDEAKDALLAMSAQELYLAATEAECAWNSCYGTGAYQAPIMDEGGNINQYAAARTWLVGTTYGEFSNNMPLSPNADADLTKIDDAKARELLEATYADKTDDFVDAFTAAWPSKPLSHAPFLNAFPPTAWSCSRMGIIAQDGFLNRLARAGATVYSYVTAYTQPLFGGMVMAHTTDLAYWFNNTSCIGYIVAGDEAGALAMAHNASDALGAFVTDGAPVTDGKAWDPWTEDNHATTKVDVECEQGVDFDADAYALMAEAMGIEL